VGGQGLTFLRANVTVLSLVNQIQYICLINANAAGCKEYNKRKKFTERIRKGSERKQTTAKQTQNFVLAINMEKNTER
jgi:hypothetical protein